MNILEIRTLRGPNYWSGYWKKLIIIRLDIGEYEDRPTDKIAIVVAVLLSALLSALLLIAGLLSGVLTFAAVAGLIWVAWRYSDRTSRRAT